MIRWADSKPRMRRNGGLFCLGDVVPEGYFTEAEIADLVSRGKVTVTESRQVEIVPVEPQAPELVEPQAPELVEPQAPELVEPQAPELVEPQAPEHEHEHEHEQEDLDEHDEPIDLGAATDKPKGRPKRRRS